MSGFIRNRALWLFVTCQALAIGVLARAGLDLEELLTGFVILGIVLPIVAWAACAGLPPPGAPSKPPSRESLLLAALLAFAVVFIAWKGAVLEALLPAGAGPRLRDAVNTAIKLAAFVAIPAAVLRWHGWPSSGAQTATAAQRIRVAVIMAAVLLAVQFVLGSQAKRLLGGDYLSRHWVWGAILCTLWMAVEAGAVEEFFFRWFLQSRLAALTGSQISGLFLAALAFGAAHAPGIWLRGAGVVEGLGAAPDFATALAYSVSSQGMVGLMFGALWARTRSLPLVIALHAIGDAAANTASFMDTWGL